MPSMTAHRTTITILPLAAEKTHVWIDANVMSRGGREVPRLSRFWDDVTAGRRVIFAAWQDEDFLGHVTVQELSDYQPFRRSRIPEIVDLWVQPEHRRRGVAQALLTEAENHTAAKGYAAIGLGVGVTADYGPAHRLYAAREYRPDGTGLWAQGAPTKNGEKITLDDDVLLMLVKTL